MTRKVRDEEHKKLRGKTRELASRFIAEEIRTRKYPREQAIAVGISRARSAVKKKRRCSKIAAIMERYR
jgi:hypothetical protein